MGKRGGVAEAAPAAALTPLDAREAGGCRELLRHHPTTPPVPHVPSASSDLTDPPAASYCHASANPTAPATEIPFAPLPCYFDPTTFFVEQELCGPFDTSSGVPCSLAPIFQSSHISCLTHVDRSGQAQMVDVSSKQDSKRIAVAGCGVLLGEKAFNLVASNEIVKGDVLAVAKNAGISGAKWTSSLNPLCNNIGLTHVRADLALKEKDFSVEIEGEATTTGKTGVEMEAMTAIAVAGLTVYDMCKVVSKDIQITELCLQNKTGGKSGSWSRKQ